MAFDVPRNMPVNFASEFLTEMSPNGGRKVHFLAKRRMEAELPIEKVGAELRGMMSWLKK